MKILRVGKLAGVTAFITLTACAGVPAGGGIDAVVDQASDRGLDIAWHQTDSARAQGAAETARILVEPLTAGSAVKIALSNNRALQVSLAETGIYRARAEQAGRPSNPLFDAGLRAPINGGGVNLDFGIVFEFLDLLRLPSRQRAALADLSATQNRVLLDVLTLAGQTRAAFLEVQACDKVAGLNQARVRNAKTALDLANILRDAGNIIEAERLDYERRFRAAERAFSQSVSGCTISRGRLSNLMGLEPTVQNWHIDERLTPLSPAATKSDLPDVAVDNSLVLAAARSEAEALSERLGVPLRAAGFDMIELGVAAERDDGAWEVGPSIALPLPLFDNGAARSEEARAQIVQADDRYRTLTASVRFAARTTNHRLERSNSAWLDLTERALPLAEAAIDRERARYNAMQSGLFGLLAAHDEALALQVDIVHATLEQGLARNDEELMRIGGMPVSAIPSAPASVANAPDNEGDH